MTRLIAFFLFLVLSPAMLWAQVQAFQSWNVKIDDKENGIVALLKEASANPGVLSSDEPAFPFLRNLAKVQALSPPNREGNTDASRCFTLAFPSGGESPIREMIESGKFEFVEKVNSLQVDLANATAPCSMPSAWTGEQWHHDFIGTFEAWDSTCGDSNVVIGIVDTGIDYFHPSLSGQFRINISEDISGGGFQPWPDTVLIGGIPGDLNGIDEDLNGFAEDVIGYDFTDQPRSPFGGDYIFEDADPADENNHGTIVAGIIAAIPASELSGIAPGCRLMNLRAFSATGAGEDDDIARAIVYGADNGVDVMNFSFGDIYPSQMMHEAVKYAHSKGVVMIASSGNGTGDEVHYPSDFDEVISVSATTVNTAGDEFLWPLSSFGLNVDLAAPGDGIYTTVIYDSTAEEPGFGTFSGTSTSAPMVSAATALVISQRGICTTQQIRGILCSAADDIATEGWDHQTGAGRLDIPAALQTVGSSHVEILQPANDDGTLADTMWITGTAIHPQLKSYSIEYQSGTSGIGTWIPIDTGKSGQIQNDTLAMWVTSDLPEGEFTIRLKLERSNGKTTEDRQRVIRDTSAAIISILLNRPVWDNDVRKHLITFRNSDKGKTTLICTAQGDTIGQRMEFDRLTRNGEFLIGESWIKSGSHEFFLEHRNSAGLISYSALDSFVFASATIGSREWQELSHSIPFGSYLQSPADFDGDGNLEVVMSESDENLSFGKLTIHEYNAGFFSSVFSSAVKPVLIPKDISDSDGDSLLELLCSVNDSMYILEQTSSGVYPSQVQWTDHGNGFYPARFADADGDSIQELIVKDLVDYFIWQKSGNSFIADATLADASPGYTGSVAPLALVKDFDGDLEPEIAFGDYDGDLLVYEHQAGGAWSLVFMDTTEMVRSGSYLASGDFDGNGKPDLFVAVHADFLRNEDFEYDPAFWLLRIFEAAGNNSWSEKWRDYLYDVDTESFNAVSSGNLDQEPAEEIVFSTFPRTYILDHNGTDFEFRWFHYGGIARSHVIGDFNSNGVNEFALGLEDSAAFFELDFNYPGPQPALSLTGLVDGADSVTLSWQPSPNATEYIIFRGDFVPGGTTVSALDSTSSLQFGENGLVSGQPYLYAVLSKNQLLTPAWADEFSNAIVLIPGNPFSIDTMIAPGSRELRITFSDPVSDSPDNQKFFTLNGNSNPSGMIRSGSNLVLEFENEFLIGQNSLDVTGDLRDENGKAIQDSDRLNFFDYYPDTTEYMILETWQEVNSKQAILRFSLPVGMSALEKNNYHIHPNGTAVEVVADGNDTNAVRITIEGAGFGALGNPLSVIVTGVLATDGTPIHEKEGNVATFTSFKSDLSGVFVYPNPVRYQSMVDGLRFANLTQQCRIMIMNASGRLIRELKESDGDGGLTWDMTDQGGNRIKPGVYIFKVWSNDTDAEFIGKFSVVE